MRAIRIESTSNVPQWVAQEIAQIGIVAFYLDQPIGRQFEMAGQRFTVIGPSTRQEFIAAARQVVPHVDPREWDAFDPALHYLRVSTD